MGKKLTYEYVKKCFEDRGYTLLSEEYVNCTKKLKYRCPKGHLGIITLANFEKGKGCSKCAGNRKLTYKEVKQFIEADGTKLLSIGYTNCSAKLDFMCPKGHCYSMRLSSFKNRGQRCPTCAGVAKHTYEFVKAYVEKDGTKLLSTEYTNCDIKLKFMCPAGHRYFATFSNFKFRGSRCSICSGKRKPSYEEVKKFVEAEGVVLLSKKYKNNKTKLNFKCPKGHEYFMNFNAFKNAGHRCPVCAGKVRFKYAFVKQYVEKDGTKLLSCGYTNSHIKLDFLCPRGHKYFMNFSEFKNGGYRCPKCGIESAASKRRLSFNEVKQYVEADGTKLLSTEYANAHTKLDFKCPKDHEYSNNFNNFKSKGQRCPRCSGGQVSKISQVWLDSLNIPGLEREHPLVINGKKYSVDGYDLATNKVYEFLGDFWHGNPVSFSPEDINPMNKKSYGQLYKETFERFAELKSVGYKIKYIWEKDFKEGKINVDYC
jgi:DNA-directed RNA polymerase subunit M/transcription elongation factor TFIIS